MLSELATFFQVGKCPSCKVDVLDWRKHIEMYHAGLIVYHMLKNLDEAIYFMNNLKDGSES